VPAAPDLALVVADGAAVLGVELGVDEGVAAPAAFRVVCPKFAFKRSHHNPTVVKSAAVF